MSARLEGLFKDYETYHRTSGNKACHYVGIPLIVFAIVGMLSELGLAAFAAVSVAVLLYWAVLSHRLALGMGIVLAMFYLGARQMPFSLLLVAFLFGWVLQFVGHYKYEGKSPAFFKNLQHLLVGPLWVLARAVSSRSAAPSSV